MTAILDTAIIKISSENDVEVTVPVSLSDMSDAERAAFLKFSAAGADRSTLTPDEMAVLAKGKIYASGDAVPEGLICRWDWTCWAV